MKSKILLLAGEESGVLYAGQLAEHLGSAGAEIRGYGDYGFKTADLAVIGFGPVLLRLFYFLGVARTMKRVIREWRPDVVVTARCPANEAPIAEQMPPISSSIWMAFTPRSRRLASSCRMSVAGVMG